MLRRTRFLAAVLAVFGLLSTDGSAFAQPNDKKGARSEQGRSGRSGEKREHKHMSGKDMVGDKIKKDGTHKFHENGKYSASVKVRDGKITGINVKHAEKGAVAVTKYKTSKQMAARPKSGIQLASLAYAQYQYIGTLWIGYGYIDDWGDEYIYWFPYDMIYDGDTGAIDYYPAW